MRQLAVTALLFLLATLTGLAQTKPVSVALFAQGGTVPLKEVEAALSCGPVVFGDQVGIVKPSHEGLCFADVDALAAGLAPGTYEVAVRTSATTWGERSLPFTVPVPKTCRDGTTVYALGEGPAVAQFGNSSASQRAVWLARERALVAAGFDVTPLLVSTSVYFAVTCR